MMDAAYKGTIVNTRRDLHKVVSLQLTENDSWEFDLAVNTFRPSKLSELSSNAIWYGDGYTNKRQTVQDFKNKELFR